MTPYLKKPVTETEVEARIRLGRPATEAQLRQGAAVNGVYYPAQEPYVGHAEDALFEASPSPPDWDWRVKAVFMFAGLVALAAVLGIFRGL